MFTGADISRRRRAPSASVLLERSGAGTIQIEKPPWHRAKKRCRVRILCGDVFDQIGQIGDFERFGQFGPDPQ